MKVYIAPVLDGSIATKLNSPVLQSNKPLSLCMKSPLTIATCLCGIVHANNMVILIGHTVKEMVVISVIVTVHFSDDHYKYAVTFTICHRF